MRSKKIVGVTGLMLAGLIATACGSSSKAANSTASSTAGGKTGLTASAPGITPTTIKIGYVTSLTGAASSTFADGPDGAMARIDAQNAAGGVNGRKIELVTADDQSSPTTFQTAAESLVQTKGVFALIPFSSFTFGGAHALQQQGIPVVGDAFDGYEWYQQPYSNMFNYAFAVSATQGTPNYAYTYLGEMLKQMGVTKVAGLSYSGSPSSQLSINATLAAAKKVGIQTCYNNSSVPFGGVDFTAAALAIKSAGCNGVVGSFVDASDIALSTALKQGGYTGKQLYFTGYDQTVLSQAATAQAFNGDYTLAGTYFGNNSPAVQTMFNDFKAYIPNYKSGSIPDLGLYGSYISADLMIKGLEEAGKNPTRASFMANLRKVTDYDAGGLLPSATSFANFGTPEMFTPTACAYLLQLKNGTFVPSGGSGGKVCGSKFTF